MTAVEFLEAIIEHCQRFGTNVEQKDIKQAKEMEKQQIIEAYDLGYFVENGEQYYKETYKKNSNEK